MADSEDGLIHAFVLDGNGGATRLDWGGVKAHWEDDTVVWVHLDYTKDKSRSWLREESGLDPLTCDSLVSTDTRPRCVSVDDGLLINLRGINHNPGEDPDDMISLRMWVDHNCLITMRQKKIHAVDEVADMLEKGKAPKNAVGLLLTLAERLVQGAGQIISILDDEIDSLEEEVVSQESRALRGRIASARRGAIGIRRFLAPQRDAMSRLMTEYVSWISDRDRIRLREVTDRVTRYVEDLDSIRDRAAVTQEELASRLAEQANKTMYVLAVITGVFLPLGLLTGLLGINVGGMPGVDSPIAFWVVCGILLFLTIIEVILLRKNRWL
jgi:zinc transporter